MKMVLRSVLLVLLGLMVLSGDAEAKRRKKGSWEPSTSDSSSSTYVDGHFRKDGTYVQGHFRSTRGSGRSRAGGESSSWSTPTPRSSRARTPAPVAPVERDASGRIKRSEKAKRDFRETNPCPVTGARKGTCPDYEIHHTVPLKDGGADTPENMQWMTDEEHKRAHAPKPVWPRIGP